MNNSHQANNILKTKMEEGKPGFKSGEGFYKYEEANKETIKKASYKKLIHQLKACNYYK